MKAATARVTHKHFFVIFLGLLSAFFLGSTSWPYSVAQNQNCSGNCESHERLAAFTHDKPLNVGAESFTLAEGINVIQAADLGGGSDVRAAAAGSIPSKTDQDPTSAQALVNPATEGGSTPGASLLSSYWFSFNRRTSGYFLPVEESEKLGYRDALAALGQQFDLRKTTRFDISWKVAQGPST